MKKLTKNQKEYLQKYDPKKRLYSLNESIDLTKTAYTKFDASVDVAIRLGINSQKAEQIVRGTAILPHGRGKNPIVLAICTPEKAKEAKEAGADYIGLDEYIKKIESGWTDVDVIVTMPTLMARVGKLGKIIGPKGLMPNPKTGTVTSEIGKAVQEIKSGKISFKDKEGIVHASVGRISFTQKQLQENIIELFNTILKLKPSTVKGNYIKSMSISSTMGKGVFVDKDTIKL